jgi:NitT/TauT family transport system ATP-binding protein
MVIAPPPSDYIQITGLSKSFGSQVVFDHFDLTLPQGQLTSLFGPNGCGKSTLLNLLAGVVQRDRGQLAIAHHPSHQSRIGYVWQNYRESLFPWLTVRENLLYPLKLQRLSQREAQQRLDQLISTGAITLDLNRYPYQFSGGQQQLIAILRAVIGQPDVLLLDEPFASLDLEMTLDMRDKLEQIGRQFNLTTLMVSHDLDDVVYLADRIVVFSQRPVRILAQIPVTLPHPRRPEALAHPEFIQVKQRCLELFLQETQR